MTSPQGRDRITYQEVRPLLSLDDSDTCADITSALNDPAIRRLVVRKCVESVEADAEIDECVRLTAFGVPVFVPVDELVAALCGPEETPR